MVQFYALAMVLGLLVLIGTLLIWSAVSGELAMIVGSNRDLD